MATRVLITVDTELRWRHYAAGHGWEENFSRSYEATGAGVPYKLGLLAQHELKACFFVDPMPALVYGLEPIRRMVEPILQAGQEVQLHIHPFWSAIASGEGPAESFELTEFDADRQRAVIEQARGLLIAAGAPPPIAFRSGSYAANAATIEALAALGFAYDSSHNGSHHPWPSALPLDARLIDPVAFGGLVEVPVSQIARSRGRLRHLQLCALSSAEMEAALSFAAEREHRLVTLVSHSFELATRDGLRPNPVLRRRFERLCRFLGEHAAEMPTAHFADLDGIAGPAKAEPLPAKGMREVARIGEQIWSEAAYERIPGVLGLRAA